MTLFVFDSEQAGGQASTGKTPLLDVIPEKIHHQVPLIISSEEDVILAEQCISKD